MKEKKLLGYNVWLETHDDVKRIFSIIMPMLVDGKLKPLIDSIYPLQEFKQAYERLKPRQVSGTILLKLS